MLKPSLTKLTQSTPESKVVQTVSTLNTPVHRYVYTLHPRRSETGTATSDTPHSKPSSRTHTPRSGGFTPPNAIGRPPCPITGVRLGFAPAVQRQRSAEPEQAAAFHGSALALPCWTRSLLMWTSLRLDNHTVRNGDDPIIARRRITFPGDVARSRGRESSRVGRPTEVGWFVGWVGWVDAHTRSHSPTAGSFIAVREPAVGERWTEMT